MMIYLDNGATTYAKPDAVLSALQKAYVELSVNAGRGGYRKARQAAEIIAECKAGLLSLTGLSAGYRAYLSSSATVTMNQILLGLPVDEYSGVYVTPFEHNAVMRPLEAVRQRARCGIQVLPFDRETWMFDEPMAKAQFARVRPDYVFLSMVSNTTGYMLPVKEITALAHEYGARVVVDCAQAMGSLDVDYQSIDADGYVFAGHKTLYGPFGVGGMLLKSDWELPCGLFGGTGSDSLNLEMPSPEAGGYEPGSPNLPAIAGLNEAIKWIEAVGVSAIEAHDRNLILRLAEKMSGLEKIHLFLPPENYVSSILAFVVDGYDCRDVGEILDEEFDIAVRTGYQCAPLVHDWLGTKPYGGVVRASVSRYNTEDDVAALANALTTL